MDAKKPNYNWVWLFVVPPFFLVAAGAAWGALDLDYGSGVFHFALFALSSLLLYWLLGGPYFWQVPPKTPTRAAVVSHDLGGLTPFNRSL